MGVFPFYSEQVELLNAAQHLLFSQQKTMNKFKAVEKFYSCSG